MKFAFNGRAVFHAGIEFPLSGGVGGLLVQAIADRAKHFDLGIGSVSLCRPGPTGVEKLIEPRFVLEEKNDSIVLYSDTEACADQ